MKGRNQWVAWTLVTSILPIVGACGRAPSAPTSCCGTASSTEAAGVTRAKWHKDPPGFQLRVTPSGYGRRHAALDATSTLEAALAAAGTPPLTITMTMRESLSNQLKCHAVFAPLKAKWDLETFRPDVGYVRTVLHHCNP